MFNDFLSEMVDNEERVNEMICLFCLADEASKFLAGEYAKERGKFSNSFFYHALAGFIKENLCLYFDRDEIEEALFDTSSYFKLNQLKISYPDSPFSSKVEERMEALGVRIEQVHGKKFTLSVFCELLELYLEGQKKSEKSLKKIEEIQAFLDEKRGEE